MRRRAPERRPWVRSLPLPHFCKQFQIARFGWVVKGLGRVAAGIDDRPCRVADQQPGSALNAGFGGQLIRIDRGNLKAAIGEAAGEVRVWSEDPDLLTGVWNRSASQKVVRDAQ